MRYTILICLISFGNISLAQTQQQKENAAADKINALLLDSRYQEAIDLVDSKPIKNLSPTGALLFDNKKAEALIRMGKPAEAEQLLTSVQERVKAKPDDFMSAITLANIGALQSSQSRYDLAIERLNESITLFNKAAKQNSLEAAQALASLGLAYKYTGKNAQAEEQALMALSLRQRILKEDHELIAASYTDLGLIYTQYDNDKALDYYDKALAIYQKVHKDDHPKIAIANTNTGIVLRDIKQYGEAIVNFEAALKIWDKIYPGPHPNKGIVLFNLGQTYVRLDKPTDALGFYDRALKMYQGSYGSKHPDIAYVENAIGELNAISFRKFDEALVHYQRALKANVSDFESDNVEDNPHAKNYYNGPVLLYSLVKKAQALEARYFGRTLKFKDLELSLKTLHHGDTLIDKLRQQGNNESDKIALGASANELYADGVRIANEAGVAAFKKKPLFELAFYFAEKSKSAVLLEAISESDAKSFAGIPANLLEKEKDLKSAIALTAQKLAQKPDPTEEKRLRQISFTINRNYEMFIQELEKQFPEYFNLKFNSATPSIAQLQPLLDQHTAMLSYFIDEANARLYIFQITRSTYKIVEHPLPKDFDRYISGLRNGLFYNEISAFKLSSYQLSKLLIPKMSSSIRDLVILPTGRLGIIPFETLLTRDPSEIMEYAALPYLINTHSVRYEFSAGLILQKSKEKNTVKPPSIFLCAPVTFPEKDNLNDLPGTEAEVKAIASLFSSKSLNAGTFTGQQASEKNIKSDKLKNYNVIHFATHGVVDESSPELSRIFLQPETKGEDGNLFAGEIYNLELNASLVTLSACQTGLGKISKGEGVIGLSRALVYAGAKNIVVSFWSVADESTAKLMQDFYTEMLQHPSQLSFSSDLRAAKLNVMKNPKYAAPYYWAPFILIGF